MKLINELRELVESYSLNDINPKTIRFALKKSFSDNWFPEDDNFTSGIRGIYTIGERTGDGEDWSIMNFFDTKKEIIEMLKKGYSRDKGDVIEYMIDKFENDTHFVENLVERQWQSIKNGVELEKKVGKQLSDIFGGPYKVFPPGSKMDRYNGIDIVVGDKTFQNKPLRNYKVIDKGDKKIYVVNTYGMRNYKSKKVDYMVYSNMNGDILIFPNRQYYVVSPNEVKHYNEPIEF